MSGTTDDAALIHAALDEGVLNATIRNPPCNVVTPDLHRALARLEERVRTDPAVRVLVLASGDPGFFLAHYDVAYAATRPAPPQPELLADLNPYQALCARFRDSPKPSLVKIAGRAGGGGIELAVAGDMRFGVRGQTVFNQMEVALGILPAAGGTQNLPELIGRGRALEMILGADDIDAATAAGWGLLNRLFDTADEMDAFVDALARRIALWPPSAVALAKRAVGAGPQAGWEERLLAENRLCHTAMADPARVPLMQAFLAGGGQTPAGEAAVAGLTHANAAALRGTE